MDTFTHLPELLREAILGLVQRDGRDLTARQLAVFLVCYLDKGPHTVRGLAQRLGVAKQVITRALNRLELGDLVERRVDPTDRRVILVVRAAAGRALVSELRALMKAASRKHGLLPAAPQAAVA
jgi:DNA-binding MarR family transcriptional regulator